MSRSVDLFIESPKPIEDFVSDLARFTRLTPTPGELPGTWSLEEGEVHAELRVHPYIDDGELVLERYQFALSTRVPDRTRPADSAEANFLRVVAEALRKGQIPSLLVHDLQYRDRVGAAAAGPPAGGAAAPVEAS
jgi:hypothetical protein